MYGFPVDGDQIGMCGQLERLGIATFGVISDDAHKIQEQIQLALTEDKFKVNTAKLMKLMEFEEKRGQKGAVYWTDYAAKFGASHLANPTHNGSYV